MQQARRNIPRGKTRRGCNPAVSGATSGEPDTARRTVIVRHYARDLGSGRQQIGGWFRRLQPVHDAVEPFVHAVDADQ